MKDYIMQPELNHITPGAAKQSGSKTQTNKAAECASPSQEEIARCAYGIYLQSGSKPGQCRRNWEQAELQLKGKSPETDQAQECDGDETPAPRPGAATSVKGGRISMQSGAGRTSPGVYDNKA